MKSAISPILVTGAHRTGTTWVGKMLCAGEQTGYISEPLNVLHRPGVFAAPVENWYTYICAHNEANYLPAYRQALAHHYSLRRELRALRTRKDWMRMGRDWGNFLVYRLQHRRPLIKDPFAVFSAPWFAEKLGCQVVITVRHPAGFASSLKRLGWSFDFNELLAQPWLVEEVLQPRLEGRILDEIHAAARQFKHNPSQQDILAQGSLLWRVIYQVVQQYSQEQPDLRIVRHEDLSLDPVKGYQALYTALGLDFTPLVEQNILNSSSSENPSELAKGKVHSTRLDSQAALHNWKRRLSADEIQSIRRLTEDVADQIYPNLGW